MSQETSKGYTRFPHRDRDGVKVGIKSGLPIMQAWDQLLYDNYHAGLTDEELTARIMRDFPNREHKYAASWYRSYFNRGVYGLGWQDEVLKGKYRLPQFKEEDNE